VGSTGMIRRAYLEASAYARHRRAFGRPIAEFPAVQATLADLRATWLGALHLVFALTALEDQIDSAAADDEVVVYHRFLVNAAKYIVSVEATAAVRNAIEIFGGNGTIEEFSVLPRLYRDSIVYESWEGTHNVLVAQVLADMHRLPVLDVVSSRLAKLLGESGTSTADLAAVELQHTIDEAGRAMTEPEFGARYFRLVLNRLVGLVQVACLLQTGEELAALHVLRSRVQGVAPDGDATHAERVTALAAAAAVD
jgi:Acyl-CoA dehydrogenase, C-terminal domain